VLADMAEMLRSTMPAINWEAETYSHLSALLSRGTFVCDGIGEPLKLSLEVAFTNLSVTSRAMMPIKCFHAPTTYENSGLDMCMPPLMLTRPLGRISLLLPSSGSLWYVWSAW
jgi:hypothetical protein